MATTLKRTDNYDKRVTQYDRTTAVTQHTTTSLHDERTRARLCIPTEFRRIPAEFRHKAPAVPVPDRNRRRNVL